MQQLRRQGPPNSTLLCVFVLFQTAAFLFICPEDLPCVRVFKTPTEAGS